MEQFTEDMYCDSANYEAAKILLRNEDHLDPSIFITHCLERDPNNVHAWCIKGMYHLSKQPPEIVCAQEAKEKMESSLMIENSKKEAFVETAYWWYVMDGSPELKEKALELFNSMLGVTGATLYSQRYSYIKVLNSAAKTARRGDDETVKEILFKLFQQLAVISKSEDEKDQFSMWSVLADVMLQFNFQCRSLINSGKVDLCEIQGLPPLGELTPMYCGQKLVALQNNSSSIAFRSSLCARIGKIFLNCAMNEENKIERKRLLNEGLERAKEYQHASESAYEQAPRVCAQLLLNLWAIEYYEENTEYVEREYQQKGNFISNNYSKKVRHKIILTCHFL